MNILIENCTIVPVTGDGSTYFTGSLGISGDKISMISRQDGGEDHLQRVARFVGESGEELKRVDGSGMAVMPGLVNIHGHASMSLMRGYADDIPLFEWLKDYVWPFEAKLTPQAIKLGAQLAISEMLLGGTTTFTDMYWMEASVAEAVEQSGIRAMLSPTFIDGKFEPFMSDLETLTSKWKGAAEGRIGVMIAPHSPYTCSPENLRKCVELSHKHDVRIQVHVSETLDEMDVIRKNYGKTPVEYLRDLGIFSRPTVAVHTVHVSESDIQIFRQFDVSIAHNPQSNTKLGNGIAPVMRMMELGINVGLGTDGACSNNDLDMWEEMRSASFLQKLAMQDPTALPACEALRMVTINGAKALGLDQQIGTLEEGKLADIILIDTHKPHLQPCHNLIANLVYCAKASDVAMTIVNGRIVAQNGVCMRIDTNSVMRQAADYIAAR